jgi:hypothetical protein
MSFNDRIQEAVLSEYFSQIVVIGKQQNRYVDIAATNNTYRLNIGLLTKKVGVFSFFCSVFDKSGKSKITNKCGFNEVIFYPYFNEENNYAFFQQKYPDLKPPTTINKEQIFFFEVTP